MKETAHLRITAQEAKELYLSGLFTTHAYLYILVRALRKDGWWLYFDSITEFCQEWGIPERSFYRAKAILVSQGYLEETIQGRLGLRCPVENEELQQVAAELQKVAGRLPVVAADGNKDPATSGSRTAKSGSWTATSGSRTAKSGSDTAPKPAQDKASTAPTDLDHLYSDLLQIEGDEDCLNEDKQPTARDGLVDPQPAEGSIDVAKILEETKRQLLAVVQRQREERERRNFRGVGGGGGDGGQGGQGYGPALYSGTPRVQKGPHLESMVATEDATHRGNGMPHPGATVCREKGTEREEHPGATPSSHGGHGQHHGQWDREDIPDLESTVATGNTTGSGSHGQDPRATTATPSSHGGHGERYMWRVRGGGLQPLAGILDGLYPGAIANTEEHPGAMGYHRDRPPFSRGIP